MDNFIYLFNKKCYFNSSCCAQNFSVTSCTNTVTKRMQEQKEEDRIVAKSMPTAMNLVVTVSTNSSSVNSPIASESLGILEASTGKPDARARSNSKPDAASSSQGWLKDAHFGRLMVKITGKHVATDKKVRNHGIFLSLNPGIILKSKFQGNLSQFLIVQQLYGRSPTDEMKGLDVNTNIWGKFLNVTLHAAVHLKTVK